MRKIIIILILLTSILLTSCGYAFNVSLNEVDSQYYSQRQIRRCANDVREYFFLYFDGCTLTELEYIGDDTNLDYMDFAIRNGYDEVMVFTSSFDVDSSGGDGSLNPNSTYTKWKWIFGRNKFGCWHHIDHGY